MFLAYSFMQSRTSLNVKTPVKIHCFLVYSSRGSHRSFLPWKSLGLDYFHTTVQFLNKWYKGISHFYNPWKRQKTSSFITPKKARKTYGNGGFLTFSGVIMMEKTFITFFEALHSDEKKIKNWNSAILYIGIKDLRDAFLLR